jgi:error-prone DNA polymerase
MNTAPAADILRFPSEQVREADKTRVPATPVPYVEFAVASNFSFLRGASKPEELILQATAIGLAGMGLCDRNSVAGVVRTHLIKRERKLPLSYHPGARLIFADGTPDILAYPRDRPGWGRLCRLLTQGNLRAQKGECILHCEDLLDYAEGLELIVMPASTREAAAKSLHHSRISYADSPVRPPKTTEGTDPKKLLLRLRETAPDRVRLAATMLYRGNDRARLAARAALAREARVPLIAVNDVLYHYRDRRELQDVLTCIREHVTIDTAGRRLMANAERHLKPGAEMARLFARTPEATEETLRLDAALNFSLDELRYEYPDESIAGFATPQAALEHLVWEGARQRYPEGITEKLRKSLAGEFALIAEREYAPYFLTVYDIVRYARSRGILCQGRGSAANSTVCYCLGITSIDPVDKDFLFARFISTERHEPPDIDVDFEHERREEVIQHVYDKYKRESTGIAATVICYRGRSATREVGKVFGLSEDTIGALTSSIWGMGGGPARLAELKRIGIDADSARIKKMRTLADEIQGFPRHLSQHVGGFVITRSRLDEVVPIMNGGMDKRTHVEWDKDDLDALNILKVDVLGLGMLTCLRKGFELLEKHYRLSFRIQPTFEGKESDSALIGFDLAKVPPERRAIYRMLCRADSIGVFQVESRAQMSMLPRLKPKEFYDLVIEVAIVRPGPIQGDMVHPYLRRRQGIEKVDYVKPELEAILKKTLGVPLFQEQAMKIAIDAGGFSPGEADQLRRAMATFKRTGAVSDFRTRMVEGMAAKGYPRDFAERCFSQIEGFGEYGFPESHAASFALLVYASAWLKCRYPDVFATALLNSQPMGFYAPAQIVRDVREHGVEVRPVDVNLSHYDATLEDGPRASERLHEMHSEMQGDIRSTHALRLGMRAIKGISEDDANEIVKQRDEDYASIRDLWLRTKLSPRVLERLADADAFGSLGLSRRQALWAVKALGRAGDQDDLPLLAPSSVQEMKRESLSRPRMRGESLPRTRSGVASVSEVGGERSQALFRGADPIPDPSPQGGGGSFQGEPAVTLPLMPPGEEVVNDYRYLSLSLRAHPASFLRDDLRRRGVMQNASLRARSSGERVAVSGLVTIRQRPGSANGVVFMTIEDETAIANLIVWPDMLERFRPIVFGARYVAAWGKMQHESGVIHVVVERLEDLTFMLGRLMQDATTQDAPHQYAPPIETPTRPADEIPAVAYDLDVTAPGSAHAPVRRRTK